MQGFREENENKLYSHKDKSNELQVVKAFIFMNEYNDKDHFEEFEENSQEFFSFFSSSLLLFFFLFSHLPTFSPEFFCHNFSHSQIVCCPVSILVKKSIFFSFFFLLFSSFSFSFFALWC